jgi:hypothetical protein
MDSRGIERRPDRVGAAQPGIQPMSITTVAVSAPPPPASPVASKTPEQVPDKTPAVKSDVDASDAANAYQPPSPPPLPPGQGTRVDQWA